MCSLDIKEKTTEIKGSRKGPEIVVIVDGFCFLLFNTKSIYFKGFIVMNDFQGDKNVEITLPLQKTYE